MNAAESYLGIGSFLIGLLFVLFPKPFSIGFARINEAIWKRHEDFLVPPDFYDETKIAKIFRQLGIVFMVQAVLLFIFSTIL